MQDYYDPSGTATVDGGRPRYQDYAANAPAYGRGMFKRLRRMGAFKEGSGFAQFNPFLASNAGKYDDVFERFQSSAGPARMKPTGKNIYNAGMDYFAAQAPEHQAAYERMLADYNATKAQGQGLLDKMGQPVISEAMLAQLQAGRRDRVAREGAANYGDVAARLAASGQTVDRAHAAFTGSQANTAYQAGQAELEEALQAAFANREGLGQAQGAYQSWADNLLRNQTGLEQFRTSLGDQQLNFMNAWLALRNAGKR